MRPYYSDELATLYHGDCREVTDWTRATALITDPPYGRHWRQGALHATDSHRGIAGDEDPSARDDALSLWSGSGRAALFGDPLIPAPRGAVHALYYLKPSNAGQRGARGGFRRDVEIIWLCGPWSSSLGGDSSVIATGVRSLSNAFGLHARTGHPHAKPGDVMRRLIVAAVRDVEPTSGQVIADPFAGSGSTLLAATQLGMACVGVEIDEAYCETAARRLSQRQGDLLSDVDLLIPYDRQGVAVTHQREPLDEHAGPEHLDSIPDALTIPQYARVGEMIAALRLQQLAENVDAPGSTTESN